MHNRITEFAEQYNILYRCQFGFRKKYLTSHALIHLINRISSAIDQRETTVGVFLDLSKAFDSLDHQILFTKLEHYGIHGVALQWIKSYFSCRRQFVQINQTCSPTQTIKYGVPEGSILGPLFFILYINDLPKVSKLTEPLLFADDTSIFFSHSNPNYSLRTHFTSGLAPTIQNFCLMRESAFFFPECQAHLATSLDMCWIFGKIMGC